MKLVHDCILPLGLLLALAPAGRADDAKPSDKKDAGPQTVHGVISDFTIVGETDVDETTGKAMIAEATLVTVIGHPPHHDAMHKDQADDKDKKDTKAASAGRERRRMNIYIVALTPKTKICEVTATGKDASAPAKEEECKLENLEIGDRVELSFNPKVMSGGADDDKGDSKKAGQKHGRHRTYFGTAAAIKLMPEHVDAEHHESTEKK